MSTPNIITIRKKIYEWDYIYFIICILLNVYDLKLNNDVIREITSYISTPFHLNTVAVNTYKVGKHIQIMDFYSNHKYKEEIVNINRQLNSMDFIMLTSNELINYNLSFLNNFLNNMKLYNCDYNTIKTILDNPNNIIHKHIDLQLDNYMIIFSHFS